MTELERLTEKLQSIFDSYKTDWLNFYDDINNSEIVKRNNKSFYKAISEKMKTEMIKDYVNYNVDDKIRTNLAQYYFDEFDSLRPQCQECLM